MHFKTKKIVEIDHIIKPSGVYIAFGAKNNINLLLSNHACKIVAFRYPVKGEKYISAPSGTIVLTEDRDNHTHTTPRFIIDNVQPQFIEEVWE